MNNHVTNWLGAYLDGELQGRRLQQVEDHLVQCAACRADLEEMQALSVLLQESPSAQGLASAERFVAQVGLRLPREQKQPVWWRALVTGWRLAPVGLVGAWAFTQALFLMTSAALIALQLGLGGDALAGLLPTSQQGTWLSMGLSLSGASLSEVAEVILRLLANGGPLGWAAMLNFAATAVIGLMIWSWLAGWCVRHRRYQSVS
jgi:predicted anti-sigma-YlaC factor YlaD